MARAPTDSVHPKTRPEWRAWLSKHHARELGVWLITYKKATGKPRMAYGDAVEEALCFGWVDSKPNRLDDERSLLRFAPRKAGTGWSMANKERVERLIATGQMTIAGFAKVQAAKNDGTWTALDAVEQLQVPEDLRLALGKLSAAEDNFAAFPRSVKRSILEWIQNARKPETRAARVAETARLASENKRANQWRSATTAD